MNYCKYSLHAYSDDLFEVGIDRFQREILGDKLKKPAKEMMFNKLKKIDNQEERMMIFLNMINNAQNDTSYFYSIEHSDHVSIYSDCFVKYTDSFEQAKSFFDNDKQYYNDVEMLAVSIDDDHTSTIDIIYNGTITDSVNIEYGDLKKDCIISQLNVQLTQDKNIDRLADRIIDVFKEINEIIDLSEAKLKRYFRRRHALQIKEIM